MPAINALTADKLVRLIATPHGPTIVDIRSDAEFAAELRFFRARSSIPSRNWRIGHRLSPAPRPWSRAATAIPILLVASTVGILLHSLGLAR